MELEYTIAGYERGAESWRSVCEQDRLSAVSEPGPATRFFAIELPPPLSESSSSSSDEDENNAARGSPPAANGHQPSPQPHSSAYTSADGSLPVAPPPPPPPPPPLHNNHPGAWENLSSGGQRIRGGMNPVPSTTLPPASIANGVTVAAPEKPSHDQSILYIVVFHYFNFGVSSVRRCAASQRACCHGGHN